MKHLPFESIYRPEFEVVEQRQGKTSMFPHTDQLPLLWRALNLEFLGGLPGSIARVDHRADDYHKLLLYFSAQMFSSIDQAARKDDLRLFSLTDQNLVTRLAIVQQITDHDRRGDCHRFRFYAGPDFSPEIYLSGRRLVFSEHVLQRFSTRVPHAVGEDLTQLLNVFFRSDLISAPVGPGRAFVVEYRGSILAFTYKESPDEYFITTCLTMNELHSLGTGIPVPAMNQHYGKDFKRPRIRNWIAINVMRRIIRLWEAKAPLQPPPRCKAESWHVSGARMRDLCEFMGYEPGSRICFLDNIPGPAVLAFKAGQVEGKFDEEDGCRKIDPRFDWAQAFAQCYGEPWPPTDETVAVKEAA